MYDIIDKLCLKLKHTLHEKHITPTKSIQRPYLNQFLKILMKNIFNP